MDKLHPVLLVELAKPKFVAIVYSDDHDIDQTISSLQKYFDGVELEDDTINLVKYSAANSFTRYAVHKDHAVILLDHSVEICSLDALQRQYDIIGTLGAEKRTDATDITDSPELTALSSKVADIETALAELKKPARSRVKKVTETTDT